MGMNALHFSSASTTVTSPNGGVTRALFGWRLLGVVVIAAMLAKWTWVFMAPKDTALPTTAAWKKTATADHLFGDVPATDESAASSLCNVQLIGVFAHPTAGFAVLSVEGKQLGVGLGEWVMAGARLVETKADHVLIERAGIKSRLDLPVGTPASAIVNDNNQPSSIAPIPVTMNPQIPPEQRAAMQQELEHFRRRH